MGWVPRREPAPVPRYDVTRDEAGRLTLDCSDELRRAGRAVLDLGESGPQLLMLWTRRGPYVIENRCPHRPRPLEDAVVRGRTLTCPGHERSFCLEGAAGRSGRLRRYPAWIQGGALVVEVGAVSAAP